MNRIIAALALAILAGGCASFGPQSFRGDPFAPAADRSLVVFIENTTMEDIRIEARSPRDRYELGMISSRSARQTSIPWSELQDLRFQLDPLSGRRATTRPASVGPGERVTLVIVQPLEQSFIRR